MNTLIKIFCALIFFVFNGFAQTQGSIKNIQEKYNTTTKLLEQELLTETALESDCNNNGQTEAFLSFYNNNNTLAYIQHNYNEGHSNYTYHYYIDNNKLIFYFFEYASWAWDFVTTPKEQGFTNEIWTYEEYRIYLNEETPIKCLYKIYTGKSIDQPHEGEDTLSETIKNKEVDCDENNITQILKKYRHLLSIQKDTTQNICDINIE